MKKSYYCILFLFLLNSLFSESTHETLFKAGKLSIGMDINTAVSIYNYPIDHFKKDGTKIILEYWGFNDYASHSLVLIFENDVLIKINININGNLAPYKIYNSLSEWEKDYAENGNQINIME